MTEEQHHFTTINIYTITVLKIPAKILIPCNFYLYLRRENNEWFRPLKKMTNNFVTCEIDKVNAWVVFFILGTDG